MKASKFTTTTETSLGYIVYTSKDNDPKEGLPLIVFLHGAGERGNGDSDLDLVNKNALPRLLQEGLQVPAIVLCPQCPSGRVWNNLIEPLKKLIDNVAAEYKVDMTKITITGISMGGFGTWEMGISFPGFFAGIAPVCGGGLSWRCEALKNTPVWAHHGDADDVVPPKNSLEMTDSVNKFGGHAKLTIYHGVGHNSWDPAYTETTLINWLLEQKKTEH